jgi:hypothetical protein
VPHPQTYINHFGSLRRAFELVGYRLSPRQLAISERSGRRHHLQKILLAQIENLFPGQVQAYSVRNRPVLRLDDDTTVSITICRCYKTRQRKEIRWELIVPRRDRGLVTLLCLSNLSYDGFHSFYLMREINIGTEYQILGESDLLLQRGQRLNSLADLYTATRIVAQAGPRLSSDWPEPASHRLDPAR